MRTLPVLILLAASAAAQNKPERLEWFRDQGFGLFIHWSVDSQTGVVISHSLAGADEAYTKLETEVDKRIDALALIGDEDDEPGLKPE